VQPPPIQRPIINRHHPRRSNSGIAPKIEPGINVTPLPPPLQPHSALSPTNRPTPSSHSASPPGTASFGSQHAPSPAGSDHLNPSMRPTPPSGPVMKATPPQMGPPVHGLPTPRSMHQPIGGLQHSVNNQPRPSVSGSTASFYPTPSFQNHIEQLGKYTPLLSFLFFSFLFFSFLFFLTPWVKLC